MLRGLRVWLLLLLLLLLTAAAVAGALAPSGLIRVTLQRRAATHHPQHRAHRLLVQQERIRRRLEVGDNATTDNATSDHKDSTFGPLVYNEVPLGVGYGTHYAELYLGIPAQRASVIVDTGSHRTALPCISCQGCGKHTDPLFDVTKSTTAKYITCKDYWGCNECRQDKCYISQSYTEGSMWSAVVIDDLAWLGGLDSKHPDRIMRHYGVRFPVGCQTKETGLFITQKENGIMGMGKHRDTLMGFMLRAKRIEHNIFTMCFSANGGSLVMGGIDYSHHESEVEYTPLVSDSSSWFPVYVTDIRVGGKSLGIAPKKINSGKGVIVDSGTTDTFFVMSGDRAFKSTFSQIAGIEYSEERMKLTEEEVARLPPVTIVLDASKGKKPVELDIPASKYLTKADDGTYYGNIHFTERSGGVLGASTMVGYDVIFDTESQRIGFADSKCDAFKTSGSATVKEAPKETEGPQLGPVDDDAQSSSHKGVETSTSDASQEKRPTTRGSGTFFVQIVAVSMVGIVAVFVWKRVRQRSWTPLADSDTSRGDEDVEAPSSTRVGSPTRRSPASSPTGSVTAARAGRNVPSPRFTIGSDSESEHGGSPQQD